MRALKLLVIVCLCSFHLRAQDRLQIGVNFSPDNCFRTLKNNDGSSLSSEIITMRNDREKPKLGYTAGLNAVYKPGERTGFEVGVQYSNKGYQVGMNYLSYGPDIDPRIGFVPGPAVNGTMTINDYFLDIPLKFSYMFFDGKFRLITGAGLAANIFLGEKQRIVMYYGNGEKSERTEKSEYDYKKFNISPFISGGFDYEIIPKHHLRAEPTLRYGILRIVDAPVTGYLWNAGLNLGYFLQL